MTPIAQKQVVNRAAALLGGWLLFACIAAAASPPEALPWETWADLRSVALVGGHYGNYLASSYCLDGCRYDRSSLDPGKGSQRFIRIEPTVDGDQGVIFEQPGAGAVTRIWMTTGDGVSQPLPSGVRIRVYFDGNPVATIDEPLDQFFNPIEYRPFMPPLASDRTVNSGGNVSYVPLTYQHGLKIALLHGADLRLWYQLNYTQVADATPVTAFADRWQFSALASLLAQPLIADFVIGKNRPITRGRGADTRLAPSDAQVGTLTTTAPLTVLDTTGSGWITSTRIQLDRSRWHDVSIAFAFDGQTTVNMPLDEFFAADALDDRNPRGLFNGVDANDAFYSTIPMPFRTGANVTLRLRPDANPASVVVRSVMKIDRDAPPDNAGTFYVQTNAACPTTPATSGDEVILAHEGTGRMVGLALWMTTDGIGRGGYYMEGDERLYIDGSVQPLWYGTGVEDMFNGGFYFDQGSYVGPLAGAPMRHASSGMNDATSMYRWFLTDAPTWRKSIVFKLENGPIGADPLCIRSAAFFFAQSVATQDVLATLDVGDAALVAAAQYQPSIGAQCASQTAKFGDEPPTTRTAGVCSGNGTSRFVLVAPRAGQAFRLRRTFDAGVPGQAAELWVNGTKVGGWPDVQVNPSRRWAQLDLDFILPVPTSTLAFEIRPLNNATVTESVYELWGDSVGTSPALDAPRVRSQSSGFFPRAVGIHAQPDHVMPRRAARSPDRTDACAPGEMQK